MAPMDEKEKKERLQIRNEAWLKKQQEEEDARFPNYHPEWKVAFERLSQMEHRCGSCVHTSTLECTGAIPGREDCTACKAKDRFNVIKNTGCTIGRRATIHLRLQYRASYPGGGALRPLTDHHDLGQGTVKNLRYLLASPCYSCKSSSSPNPKCVNWEPGSRNCDACEVAGTEYPCSKGWGAREELIWQFNEERRLNGVLDEEGKPCYEGFMWTPGWRDHLGTQAIFEPLPQPSSNTVPTYNPVSQTSVSSSMTMSEDGDSVTSTNSLANPQYPGSLANTQSSSTYDCNVPSQSRSNSPTSSAQDTGYAADPAPGYEPNMPPPSTESLPEDIFPEIEKLFSQYGLTGEGFPWFSEETRYQAEQEYELAKYEEETKAHWEEEESRK